MKEIVIVSFHKCFRLRINFRNRYWHFGLIPLAQEPTTFPILKADVTLRFLSHSDATPNVKISSLSLSLRRSIFLGLLWKWLQSKTLVARIHVIYPRVSDRHLFQALGLAHFWHESHNITWSLSQQFQAPFDCAFNNRLLHQHESKQYVL